MSNTATMLHQLTNRLPSGATWEDVCYEVELLASIDRGLQQANTKQGVSSEELLASLGLLA